MNQQNKHKATNLLAPTKGIPFFGKAVVQPKLTINEPNDKYEQEADTMAEKIMTMPASNPGTPLPIQRKCSGCAEEERVQPMPLVRRSGNDEMEATPLLSGQLNSSKGRGSQLPAHVNQQMSGAFGTDFSQVRVHTDEKSQQMNQGIQAKAFTHGSNVYFNKGQYNPDASDGKRLLAHELTHVVQQSGRNKEQATPKRIQRSWLGALVGAGIGGLAGGGLGGVLGGGVGALVGGILGAGVGAVIGAFIGNDSSDPETAEATQEAEEETPILEPALQTYLLTLAARGQIENQTDSDRKARMIIDFWLQGDADYVLSKQLQVLLIRELTSGDAGNEENRTSLLAFFTSVPNNDFNAILNEVGRDRIVNYFPEDYQGEINVILDRRIANGPTQAADPSAIFDSNTIASAQQRFHENSQLDKNIRENCINIIRELAPQFFSNNPDLSATIRQEIDDLEGLNYKMTEVGRIMSDLGLTSHYIPIRFNNRNGNNEPTEMTQSAWDAMMEAVGDQQGWHIFGMALFNGYHSVTIMVHKTPTDAFLYWADQWAIDPGEDFGQETDSISGFRRYDKEGLDQWITSYTRSRWNSVFAGTNVTPNVAPGRRREATCKIWKFRSQLENTAPPPVSTSDGQVQPKRQSIQAKFIDHRNPNVNHQLSSVDTGRKVVQRDALDEEQRLQDPTIARYSHAPSFATFPTELSNDLAQTSNFQNIVARANWWGYKLWEEARVVAQRQGDTDDRPIYWTRLRMRQMLRNFNPGSRFTMTSVQREQLILGFESASRGMHTGNGRLAWIPGGKRILISGFDPFGLSNISHSNPSGAAVLALDGQIVHHPNQRGLYGQIQGVILPVNYNYFDNGNVEQFFRPYIQRDNQVDMVMTISQGQRDFELEEHASRYREPTYSDNETESGGSAIFPAGSRQDEFIRSNLPRHRMRRDALGRRDSIPQERQFEGLDAQGNLVADTDGPNTTTDGLRARKGSGGVFLSNEVFYRTSLLRIGNANQNEVKVGHLHIPIIEEYARLNQINIDEARNRIINQVKQLIIAALPSL